MPSTSPESSHKFGTFLSKTESYAPVLGPLECVAIKLHARPKKVMNARLRGFFSKAGRLRYSLVLISFMLPLAFSQTQTATRRAPDQTGRAVVTMPAISVQANVIPRIICGNGWETEALLVNTATAPASFQQFFFAAAGTFTAFTVRSSATTQSLTTSSVQGVLNPGSSLNLTFCDAAGTAQEGWSYLTYSGAPGTISGYATIRRTALSGTFHFETVIPLSSIQQYSALVPFDNTQGFRSQLTIVNPAMNLAAQVRLIYLDSLGNTVIVDTLTLPPGQQQTLVLPDVYPDLANKTGTISVEGDTDRLSVMALRYNDLYGAVVSLPAI